MKRSAQSGHAAATAMALILGLSAVVGGLLSLSREDYERSRRWRDETRAYFAAETGVNRALAALEAGGPAALRGLGAPWSVGTSVVTVRVARPADDPDLPPDCLRLAATGREGAVEARVEVVVRPRPGGAGEGAPAYERLSWEVPLGGPNQEPTPPRPPG